MAIITAIEPSPRQAGRFIVMVDGHPAATVAIDTIERLSLGTGKTYDGVRAAVELDAAALHTLDRALNMLAARARSSRDLRRQLVRKGEPPELVELAIGRLVANGLLDDAMYARQLARSKVLGPGHSRRRLQQEMFRRGVDRDVADEAIAEVFAEDEVDEGAIVERVARKKLRSLARLDPETRRRRLYAFLARRGYDLDDIRDVLSGLAPELAADAADGALGDIDEPEDEDADDES